MYDREYGETGGRMYICVYTRWHGWCAKNGLSLSENGAKGVDGGTADGRERAVNRRIVILHIIASSVESRSAGGCFYRSNSKIWKRTFLQTKRNIYMNFIAQPNGFRWQTWLSEERRGGGAQKPQKNERFCINISIPFLFLYLFGIQSRDQTMSIYM